MPLVILEECPSPIGSTQSYAKILHFLLLRQNHQLLVFFKEGYGTSSEEPNKLPFRHSRDPRSFKKF
jgi:hypothetical protein